MEGGRESVAGGRGLSRSEGGVLSRSEVGGEGVGVTLRWVSEGDVWRSYDGVVWELVSAC